ncbi:MAG: nuclear transport factor 2 family protein [Acidobacteriota bacterium]
MFNRGTSLVIALTVSVLTSGCASTGTIAGKDAMSRLDQSFTEAVNAANADAVAALYARDAVFLPPNTAAIDSPEGIREFWKTMLGSMPGARLELMADESESSGDMGYERGRYRLLGADGSEMDRGKFLQIFRSRNGQWELTRDMFSSDLPPQPPPKM